MTSAPVLRSAALQKALALIPVRSAPPTPAPGTPAAFATSLAHATRRAPVAPRPAPSVWSAAAVRTVAPAGAASLSSDGAIPFKDLITAAARKYGLDPALLAGLVKQESNFSPTAQSGAGARGLTQLMDATARGLGVTDSFDPAQSLDGGARFLGGLLKQFHGDESLALAAYNAGPGAVTKYGGIPPYEQTQLYVPKVLGYATQYRRIWADATATPATPTKTT